MESGNGLQDDAKKLRLISAEQAGDFVAGHGEAEPSRDHGVHADDGSGRIGQRAAGVARRQPHSGLNPFARTESGQRANGVNDAGGQRAHEAERITDGDDEFAGAQAIGIA